MAARRHDAVTADDRDAAPATTAPAAPHRRPAGAARAVNPRETDVQMKTRFVRWMLAPALLLGALAGCEGLLSDGDDVQREQYDLATGRWEAANVTSYSYVLSLACACAPLSELRNVRVTVQDGAVVSRVYESNNPAQRTPASEAVFGPYDTVEELFAAVQNSIRGDADILNIVYHPTYGVPTLLQWDPDSTDPEDHLVIEVSGFTPATGS